MTGDFATVTYSERSRRKECTPIHTSLSSAIATGALTIVARCLGEADLAKQRIGGGVAILVLCLGRGRDGIIPRPTSTSTAARLCGGAARITP
jgi:hypothetical protein